MPSATSTVSPAEAASMADWIVDLGPDGGDLGGHIVATGTPEDIISSRYSHTGKILLKELAKSN